jgi:hypothetical protein
MHNLCLHFYSYREFKSLVEVLGVVGEKIDTLKGKGEDLLSALKDHNRAYSDLLFQVAWVYCFICFIAALLC